MDDAQKFCDECGELAELDAEVEAAEEEAVEENEDSVCDEGAEMEVEIEVEMEAGEEEPAVNEKPIGLKWYKFISYFALYAVAVVNVLLGLISKLNGDEYSELFSYYVSEKMGVFFGIAGNFILLLCVFTAVLMIATGVLLVIKKGIGIKLNHICVGAMAVVLAARNVMNGIVLLYMGATDIQSIIVSAVNYLVIGGMLIALNKVYFEKRTELFKF